MQRTINRLRTLYKYRELFFQLVSRDIKLKYRRSVLGYFWSMLNPLLTMLVMVIVFSKVFERSIPYFPIYLLIGNMLFSFMTGAVSRSLNSVLGNAGLLKKIYIPKYIFTLSAVTSEFVTFLFSLGACIVLIFATRTPITWYFSLTIIPIVQLYIFNTGLGLFMAQANVFFRDIVYIWHILSTAWMYLSAIFYPVTILPERIHYLVTHYNPMYFYITMFRNFTLEPTSSDSLDLVIRGMVAAFLMLFTGLVSFSLNKNKFILHM